MATINNDWITLTEKRNGVDVQRKFGGLDTDISENNEVLYCNVKYWERELYPNGEVIKTEKKWYSLENLSYTEVEIDGKPYYMEALAVLDGFINSLGYSGIINPSRDTLDSTIILPLNSPNGYPLRKNTRNKIEII
jgi:hypothetical protein